MLYSIIPSGPSQYPLVFKVDIATGGSRDSVEGRRSPCSGSINGRQLQTMAEAVSSSDEREENKHLRAKLKLVEQECGTLKSRKHPRVAAFIMSRYQFIKQVATTEPVQVLCRVLHVSVASY